MILKIDNHGSKSLDQPSDLKRFKISVEAPVSCYLEVAARGGDGLRFQDSGTAWVGVDSLIAMSGLASDPQWRSDFKAMLGYCQKMGWLSADGREVQAHVEWKAAGTST